MRAAGDELTPGGGVLKIRHIGFEVRISCLKVKGVSVGPDLLARLKQAGKVTWEGVRCWTLRTPNGRGDVCLKKKSNQKTSGHIFCFKAVPVLPAEKGK